MNNLKEMVRLSIIGFIALVVMGIVMSLYSCGSHKSTTSQETSIQRKIVPEWLLILDLPISRICPTSCILL